LTGAEIRFRGGVVDGVFVPRQRWRH
jgi:hypothetical protein